MKGWNDGLTYVWLHHLTTIFFVRWLFILMSHVFLGLFFLRNFGQPGQMVARQLSFGQNLMPGRSTEMLDDELDEPDERSPLTAFTLSLQVVWIVKAQFIISGLGV